MAPILIIASILFSLFLSSRWLLDGNLLFHADIARDFYLLQDIWGNKHLTLIGPRAGGLTGWFHGPLWLYFNLPAYILGGGHPLIVGWYWFGWHLATICLVFVVARKIHNHQIALLSALVYSSTTILDVHSYLNPQGALIVFPLFFYFYWKYIRTKSTLMLTVSLFLLGLMIQFQIAFGAPLLLVTFVDNLLLTLQDRKFYRFLSYLVLFIPLSTYLFFDLRHDFIQLKSIVGLADLHQSYPLIEKIKTLPLWLWLSIPLVFLKNKDTALQLFLKFYLGFWIIGFFFNGQIMSYYYSPFLPVLVIITIALTYQLPRFISTSLIIFIVLFGWKNAILDTLNYSSDVNRQDWSTWNSVKTAANWTLNNCGPDSGYFVYTPDLYGYNLHYALDFLSSQNKINIFPYQKRPITCLLMGPNVRENPYGSANWKSGDIKISGKLVDSITYGNGISVEKYQLTPQDLQISPNPYLIKDAFFR